MRTCLPALAFLLAARMALADTPANSSSASPHPGQGSWRWTSEPHRYPGTNSDMHWWTWANDGSLIVVDEDGKNFDGPWGFGHVLKVTGKPPHHRVEELAVLNNLGLKDGVEPGQGYMEAVNAKGYSRYVGGVVAVGSVIYISVYDYTWQVEGLPFAIKDLYSAHGGLVGWLRSDDGGVTWEKRFRDGAPYFLGPRFTALQWINFGPGNSGTPDGLNGWIYAVSNDSNWESGDNLFLARVPPGRIEDRSAWEFFDGTAPGGQPLWTNKEQDADPIHTDPGHVGHSSISYNPARKVYWLATFSDTIPHRIDTPVKEAQVKWDVTTQLKVYEGKNPWGPWTLIHHELPWGGPKHAAYLPMIPTPWMDPDGLGGTILFTGDWAKHGGAWYGFMTQSFRLGPVPATNPH